MAGRNNRDHKTYKNTPTSGRQLILLTKKHTKIVQSYARISSRMRARLRLEVHPCAACAHGASTALGWSLWQCVAGAVPGEVIAPVPRPPKSMLNRDPDEAAAARIRLLNIDLGGRGWKARP